MHKTNYTVAEHTFCINHSMEDIETVLPSYEPFRCDDDSIEPLFTITIDDSIQPCWQGRRMGFFPCNAANFEVYRQGESSYQVLIMNDSKIPCAFMQTDDKIKNITLATRGNARLRKFGINNAIMLAYTLATATHGTLLMHSSVVENNGMAYMFLGASGSGKSTHSDLWVQHIPGSTIINDDNPVVRIAPDGTPLVYGSPWSGKRPVYKRVHYPVAGFAAIEQHKSNSMHRQSIPSAFSTLLSSCSTMNFDRIIHISICGTISKVLEKIPVYTLQCRPDKEAVEVANSVLRV